MPRRKPTDLSDMRWKRGMAGLYWSRVGNYRVEQGDNPNFDDNMWVATDSDDRYLGEFTTLKDAKARCLRHRMTGE